MTPSSPPDRPGPDRCEAGPTDAAAGGPAPRAGGRGQRPPRGFVYAATGADYVALARRSARTLRRSMPRIPIDLFTDADLEDPVFTRIHRLERSSHRPKMEALRRSRFERTVLLDADTIVLANVSEIFDLLGRYDILGASGTARNAQMGYDTPDIPRAWPLINSGVLAVRRSPQTRRFLADWEQGILDGGHRFDQPVLRRLLWESDLSLMVLPYEYNLMNRSFVDRWKPYMGAPRILHVPGLHEHAPGDPALPFDLDEVMGAYRAARLRWLLASDLALGGNPKKAGPEPRPPRATFAVRALRRLRRTVVPSRPALADGED